METEIAEETSLCDIEYICYLSGLLELMFVPCVYYVV